MSEVLIRMKMPQCCEECRFFAWKRGVGQHCAVDDRITFHATLDGFDVGYERNGDCPLVPVPSHGRLIDFDRIEAIMKNACDECKESSMEFDGFYADCGQCLLDGVKKALMSAPTIIQPKEE